MKISRLLQAGVLCVVYMMTLPGAQVGTVNAADRRLAGYDAAPALAITVFAESSSTPSTTVPAGQPGQSRGYLTTPEELAQIKQKAEKGIEPYADAVEKILSTAKRKWDYSLNATAKCKNANSPSWLDNERGIPRLYARALAFHLAESESANLYAEEVIDILEQIMTEVKTISLRDQQCQLNFGWNTPELVAAADLIESYWHGLTCTGPTSTAYDDIEIGSGDCKQLFQNWLVKNPYYVVSYTGVSSKSNWGAAGTNTMSYIADYLWDRPQLLLIHRNPRQLNNGEDSALTPAEAYAYANKLMFERMNGYAVDYQSSKACDYFSGSQQSSEWSMVKSQITEQGIIADDARRDEHCNIRQYNGQYQNYPQVHLGNNIQQCELMLRRGDSSCYDNVENTEIPKYSFVTPDGKRKTTHLYSGRGSIERAIKAVIVDSKTPWRHNSALDVAYRYYYDHHTLDGFEEWAAYLGEVGECAQDICFGTLTHGFARNEEPTAPPTVAPPLPTDEP